MKRMKQTTQTSYEMPSATVVGLQGGLAILAGSQGTGGNETYTEYQYDWTEDLN